MLISEVFGHGVDNQAATAWDDRRNRRCPFKGGACTKSSQSDPIGICSLSDGQRAAAVCPNRFVENDVIFKDAARHAFGEGVPFGVFPEIKILKIRATEPGGRDKKIGKVDYVIGKLDGSDVVDFAAVEVQAVYFSGGEIRTALRHYIDNGTLDIEESDRRPDFRSSAQKRLVPQLQLKVPVFRRWGKKFFVVVDTQFFSALPTFSETTPSNSEVTWLAYGIERSGDNYTLGAPRTFHSEWDEVRNALREGSPPEPGEIIDELQAKLTRRRTDARILTS